MANVNTFWTVACGPRRSKWVSASPSLTTIEQTRAQRRTRGVGSEAFLTGNVLRSRQPTSRGTASQIPAIPDPKGAGVARPVVPAGQPRLWLPAKLSTNAENSGSETTTR